MLRTHENSIVNLIFAAGLVIYGLLVWTGRATRPKKLRWYAIMGFLILGMASLMGPKRAFAGPWIAVPAGTIFLAALGAMFLWLEPRKAGQRPRRLAVPSLRRRHNACSQVRTLLQSVPRTRQDHQHDGSFPGPRPLLRSRLPHE
jgi:hypothetical protein